MDKKKTYKLTELTVIVALVLILVLFAAGVINDFVASIFGAIIGLAAVLVFSVFNSTTNEDREKEKMHRAFKREKVQRTREGTIFEAATTLILVCSLIIGIANHTFEQGESILRDYAFCFIAAIAFLILAYHPVWGCRFCYVTNAEQFKLLIRKNRVGAIVSALMALILSISPVWNHLIFAILIGLLITWLGADFLFFFLFKKNK